MVYVTFKWYCTFKSVCKMYILIWIYISFIQYQFNFRFFVSWQFLLNFNNISIVINFTNVILIAFVTRSGTITAKINCSFHICSQYNVMVVVEVEIFIPTEICVIGSELEVYCKLLCCNKILLKILILKIFQNS